MKYQVTEIMKSKSGRHGLTTIRPAMNKLLQLSSLSNRNIMSNRIYRGLHGVEPCAGRKKIVNVRAAAIRASPMESCLFTSLPFRSCRVLSCGLGSRCFYAYSDGALCGCALCRSVPILASHAYRVAFNS